MRVHAQGLLFASLKGKANKDLASRTLTPNLGVQIFKMY